jgi:hypothetical protein
MAASYGETGTWPTSPQALAARFLAEFWQYPSQQVSVCHVKTLVQMYL